MVDDYAEFEMCNEYSEDVDRDTNGVETSLFDAEELIEQLRVCNSVLNIPSDVTIRLDRFAPAIRRSHMATTTTRTTTITSHFKAN